MLIEKLEELNCLISDDIKQGKNCVLAVFDNKSDIVIQYVIVKHPLDFIRNLNEISKNLRLPVSDMDINLIGFVSSDCKLSEVEDIVEISPYVYFKKPEDVDVSVGSDTPVPSTEV